MRNARRIVEAGVGGRPILVALLLGALASTLAGSRPATAASTPDPSETDSAAGTAPTTPAPADTATPQKPATSAPPATAAEAEDKPPKRWSNSTEFSLVVTEGNSTVQTLGLKNTLGYKADRGRVRFRFDALRSDTSDDPYLLVQPGLTFLPGETVVTYSTTAVRPPATPDVSRFFSEGRYDGDLKNKATWNAGASWDMDEDAGILSRTILFSGLGHTWRDLDDLKFRTTYGLSWTDRIEEVDDPEKEQTFLGARLTSLYKDRWGKSALYENDFTLNISIEDFSDYNADLTQSVSVNVSNHLALKVSLQLTYAGEPALEEVDVVARAILIDPDGIPGTGDEYFQTVESGGIEILIGEDTLRRENLDTTFRTSLQITY